MSPRVSVILPVYKHSADITPAIGSILNQTFADFELVIVDNQTDEANYEIISDFASRDSRIILVDEPRHGRSFVLNSGIEHATAAYIAILEPYDIAFPERLEKQVEYLDQNPETGLVASRVRYFSHDENPGLQFDYINTVNNLLSHDEISFTRFIESPLLHSTVCYRRSLIDTYGGYKHLAVPEDYELWLRWLKQGVNMHKLPDYLVEWQDSQERFSPIEDQHCVQDYFEIVSTYLNDYLRQNNPYGDKVVVWGAGRRSRQRFALLHELGYWPKFFIDMRGNEEKNVIQFRETPPAGSNFIISYVANREGRDNLRHFLAELGYVEGKDFICVA